jgi:hypothetical protein
VTWPSVDNHQKNISCGSSESQVPQRLLVDDKSTTSTSCAPSKSKEKGIDKTPSAVTPKPVQLNTCPTDPKTPLLLSTFDKEAIEQTLRKQALHDAAEDLKARLTSCRITRTKWHDKSRTYNEDILDFSPLTSPMRGSKSGEEFVPQCSGHVRMVPICFGNIYGESRHPVDIEKDLKGKGKEKVQYGKPSSSCSCSPLKQSSSPEHIRLQSLPKPMAPPMPYFAEPSPSGHFNKYGHPIGDTSLSKPLDTSLGGVSTPKDLAQICQEGGVDLIAYLLETALPISDLTQKSVKEWTYCDYLRLAEGPDKEKWHQAHLEELEEHHQRGVYNLVPLPKGCKAIGNHWVYNIKRNHTSDLSQDRYCA